MFEKYNDFMTVEEVCEALMIGRGRAYELLNNKEIPAFRIGEVWKIPKEALEQYVYNSINNSNQAVEKQSKNMVKININKEVSKSKNSATTVKINTVKKDSLNPVVNEYIQEKINNFIQEKVNPFEDLSEQKEIMEDMHEMETGYKTVEDFVANFDKLLAREYQYCKNGCEGMYQIKKIPYNSIHHEGYQWATNDPYKYVAEKIPDPLYDYLIIFDTEKFCPNDHFNEGMDPTITRSATDLFNLYAVELDNDKLDRCIFPDDYK